MGGKGSGGAGRGQGRTPAENGGAVKPIKEKKVPYSTRIRYEFREKLREIKRRGGNASKALDTALENYFKTN